VYVLAVAYLVIAPVFQAHAQYHIPLLSSWTSSTVISVVIALWLILGLILGVLRLLTRQLVNYARGPEHARPVAADTEVLPLPPIQVAAHAVPDTWDARATARPVNEKRGVGRARWLLVIGAVVVLAGLGSWFGYFRYRGPAPPLSRQDLRSAQQSLVSDWHRLADSEDLQEAPSQLVAPLQLFAGEIGRLALPDSDITDAHALIRAVITVSNDEANVTWTTAFSSCGALPGCWQFPPSFSSDWAMLNTDYRVLYADLGGA